MNEAPKFLGMDRRLVIVIAAVLLLAVMWVLVLNPLLFGAAGDGQPLPPVAAASEVVPSEEPTLEPSEELPPIDETFEVFSARDPFEQLVDDAEAVPTVVADTSADATGTEVPTVDADPAANPPATTTEDGTTVVVDDVFAEDGTEYVLLTANDTVYTLTEGEDFATNWRVEAIDDPCVTLLYGDQARLVCEGESIRK